MKYKQLTQEERYQIYALIKAGNNQKQIADELTRSPSSISRELKRNKGLKGYRPNQENNFTEQRRKSSFKASKLTDDVTDWINRLLVDGLSPEQVAGRLALEKSSFYIMKKFINIFTEIRLVVVNYIKHSLVHVKSTRIQLTSATNC